MVPFEQGWNRLRKNKRRIKIRILVAAAIPRPPTGVDGKLREIGEPIIDFLCVDPRRRAAFQSSKFTQINLLCSDKLKVSVEEGVVAELVLRIVVDILRHVRIEIIQRVGVD